MTTTLAVHSFNRGRIAQDLSYGDQISSTGATKVTPKTLTTLVDFLREKAVYDLGLPEDIVRVNSNGDKEVELVIKNTGAKTKTADKTQALAFKVRIGQTTGNTTVIYGKGTQEGNKLTDLFDHGNKPQKEDSSGKILNFAEVFARFETFINSNEADLAKWDADVAESQAKALGEGDKLPHFLLRRVLGVQKSETNVDGWNLDDVLGGINDGLVEARRNGNHHSFDISVNI